MPTNTPHPRAGLARRTTIGGALAVAGTAAAADDPVPALLARVAEKNDAFMRGAMSRWAELVPIAADFTLFQPFGGAATHGFDTRPERLAEMARVFRNGASRLEPVAAYAVDGLIVLVTVEHQHGEVGGLADQDWTLRVTEVWRRAGDRWALAHRHADPLSRRRSIPATAALARGEHAA